MQSGARQGRASAGLRAKGYHRVELSERAGARHKAQGGPGQGQSQLGP